MVPRDCLDIVSNAHGRLWRGVGHGLEHGLTLRLALLLVHGFEFRFLLKRLLPGEFVERRSRPCPEA
jgi:hypothetical protein